MRSKKRLIFVVLTTFFLFSYGQQTVIDSTKIEQLEEVVISDSRFELKRENSGKTVIKITQKELKNSQGKTLTQIINSKSGFEINGSRGVAGQNLTSFVRGGNNRQILVVIDGVQVNDPSLVSNEFDLRLLDINTIESIEIIKGASSTLYGNSAATAVINITSKKASKKKIAANFSSTIGTNQPQENDEYNIENFTNNFSINGTINKLSYFASFGHQKTDGLSAAKSDQPEADPFSRYNVNLKLNYKFSDQFNLSTYGSIDRFETGIDGFPPPNFTFADTNDEFLSKQQRIGIASTYKYKNGEIHLNTAFTDIERETISAFGSINEAESFVLDLYNKYTFNNNIYTIVGFNYGDYKSLFTNEESFSTKDPYLNLVYVSELGFTINAGARLNNHSEYGSQFVYNVNPSYRIKANGGYAKVFGSFATSFIAPNLSQLFGFFGPNPNLEPEENRTIEGGFEYQPKKGVRVSALYFNREEENTIIFTSAYENASENATVQGFEFEAEVNLIENLSFTGNYSFTEVKDGERLRVPKHRAYASLGYTFSKNTYASLDIQHVGERTDTNFSTFTNETLESYNIHNLYFSHQIIKDRLKVFANINNLFNEDYFEIIGYTTQGRNASLGINLNF